MNCGVKNYMTVGDHRSYRSNLCSCEKKEAWKKRKKERKEKSVSAAGVRKAFSSLVDIPFAASLMPGIRPV